MRIGARGSNLAQYQAHWVADILRRGGIESEQVIIQTHGDRFLDRPLDQLGVQGVFTREIEEALLAEEIDLAVHSFKDMATRQPPALMIAAITERVDPAELLLVRKESFDRTGSKVPLSPGAVVGTSAVRRERQLLAWRSDLEVRSLRGNVPTRLEKLARGNYDAIFLAAAGVQRLALDLTQFEVVRIDPHIFIPCPGQGALALEMREDDPQATRVRELLHHPLTASATALERQLLTRFGGGCSLPLGAYAEIEDQQWQLSGFWGGEGGPLWERVNGAETELAEQLHSKLTGD